MQDNIQNTINALKKGEIILHKTDTVWGLACDATDDKAIEKIINLKNRPADKSFILLVSDITQLNVYVEKIPDIAWDLVEFAEKPLTVIYPKGKNLPISVMASDGSIAIRVVKEKRCRDLIYKFGKAIISTSANISGEKTPITFSDIKQEIKDKVDYIEQLEGLESISEPSTIVQLGLNGDFKFIRK